MEKNGEFTMLVDLGHWYDSFFSPVDIAFMLIII